MKTDFETYDEEWFAVVAETMNWGASSRESSASMLRRLHRYEVLDRPITEASEQKLLDLARKVENPNSRVAAIHVLCAMRNCAERPVDLLAKHRRKVISQELPKYRRSANASHVALDHDQLWAGIAEASKSNPQRAIVLCLLASLGCRIRDMYAVVTTDKKVAEESDDNVVLIRTKDVLVIRRVYKTAVVYGTRRDKIDGALGKVLRKALIAGEFAGGMLIRQANGKDTPCSQLSTRVRVIVGSGFSATDLFKCWVNVYRERGDFQRLREFSETRGTSLATLLKCYDVSVLPAGFTPIGSVEGNPDAAEA